MTGLEQDTALLRALATWSKLTPAAIAKKAGVAATTINRSYRGTASTRISAPTLDKLRGAFPTFPQWVAEPELPPVDPQRDYLPVEVMPSFAGMGGGGTGEGDTEHALIPRRLIVDELRAKPSDLLLVEARGSSMEPDFRHGDQILIDRRDTNPAQPGAFALWDGDGYVIKLLERVPQRKGFLRVFSANDTYSAYEVDAEEIRIMGRPVWFGRRL